MAELNFENLELKTLAEQNDAIENALKHHNPYHELLKVFKTYGHFILKSIIFGHRLYRACYLDLKEVSPRSVWESFDFATNNNDILNEYELKKWVNLCLESNIDSWQVINWKGLDPLYNILDQTLQKDIKFMLGIGDQTKELKERVLMTGIGFFSAHTRNLAVLALGIHSFKYHERYEYKPPVPKRLLETPVICEYSNGDADEDKKEIIEYSNSDVEDNSSEEEEDNTSDDNHKCLL
ncbi:23835_t:CDS:2 [Racocetra persica]|uniref:23835_t:CDS:1 n=1 Tax=Racocetra persica TaxID=160502 RepID=A0ACA9LZV9_9GLOM|nr:23835_t:CDS:2 [Racocetra persica]